MNYYSSSLSCSDIAREEEPFHFTPAYNPEDIICPGSDTEETPEETQQKRLRYEQHAQRVFLGQLPVLESARLKGPFAEESGWLNPWRPHPRKVEDWWQPENLEEMMFTKANVLRRAAQFGLDHLSNKDAIAWCRASAEAEADAMSIEGNIMQSVEDDSQAKNDGHLFADEDIREQEIIDDGIEASLGDNIIDDPSGTYGRSDLPTEPRHRQSSQFSMETHGIGSPHTNRAETRKAKRPDDLEWLKGSYVSKRARWNGPAIATPTPLAALLPARERRRFHNSSKLARPEHKQKDHASRSRFSFPDIPQAKSKMAPGAFGNKSQTTKSPPGNQIKTKKSSSFGNHVLEQEIITTTLQEDTVNYPRRTSKGAILLEMRSPKSKAQKTPAEPCRLSLLDRATEKYEADVIRPATNRQYGSSATNTGCLSSVRSNSTLNRLPKLPPNTTSPCYQQIDPTYEDEASFFSEVAPSSYNVEEFQFRKKRRRTNPSLNRHQSKPSPTIQTLNSSSKTSREATSKSHAIIRDSMTSHFGMAHELPEVQEAAPSNSDLSNEDWDTIDDITYNSSFLTNAAIIINRQGFEGPTPARETDPASSATKSSNPSRESPERPDIPFAATPSQPQTLPALPESPNKSLVPSSMQLPILDLNDCSTQPYNMTLNMSGGMSIKSSKMCETPAIKCGNASSSEGNYAQPYFQDDMDMIQQALSQALSEEFDDHDSEDDSRVIQKDDLQQDGNGQDYEEPNDLNSEDGSQVIQEVTASLESRRKNVDAETENLETNISIPNNIDMPIHDPADIDNRLSPDSCKSQSPWAAENSEPISLPFSPENVHQGVCISNPEASLDPGHSLAEEATPVQSISAAAARPWQQHEHDSPLRERSIMPFSAFQSSPPFSRPPFSQLQLTDLTNSQVLVDATTRNPWINTARQPSPTRSRKRVSFGILPSPEQIDSEPESSLSRTKRRPAPPPPPQNSEQLLDEDDYDDTFNDDNTTINKSIDPFVAARLPRQCPRVLPENGNSPVGSSPAFGAQAEAFIAADQEISSTRTAQAATLLKNPSRRPKNCMSDSTIFRDSQHNPWHVNSEPTHGRNVHDDLAGFDMEEALGEAGSFLQDWSIETEIQKSKEAESTSRRESAGFRRGNLCGLV